MTIVTSWTAHHSPLPNSVSSQHDNLSDPLKTETRPCSKPSRDFPLHSSKSQHPYNDRTGPDLALLSFPSTFLLTCSAPATWIFQATSTSGAFSFFKLGESGFTMLYWFLPCTMWINCCCCRVPQSCLALCCSMLGLPVLTVSQGLLRLMVIELVMPFNHSSSVVPFSSCPQSFPATGNFPMSQLLTSGGQSIGASAQHQSFQWIFRIELGLN